MIMRMLPGVIGFADPGLRIQRQPVTHGGITRQQVAAFIAQEPRTTLPVRTVTRQWQHMADHVIEPLAEYLAQSRAFERIVET